MHHAAEIQSALDSTLDAAMEMLGADMGNIQVYSHEADAYRVAAHRGFDLKHLGHFHEVTEMRGTACGRALRLRQRAIVPDILKEAAYVYLRDQALAVGYRGVQSTPLINRQGELLGILSTHFKAPHQPTDVQLRMLDLYAQQAVDTMESARLAQAVLRSEQRYRFLDELSETLRQSLDPGIIMAVTLERLGQHLNVHRSFYADRGPDSDTLTVQNWWSREQVHGPKSFTLSQLGHRSEMALGSGRTLAVGDVPGVFADSGIQHDFLLADIRAFIFCPIMKEGKLAGILGVVQSECRAWQADEIALLEQVMERSWAHMDRARVTRNLSESEERYRTFVTTTPSVVWHTNHEGRIVHPNESWSAFTGQTFEQCRDWGWLNAIHPDDRPLVMRAWETSQKTASHYQAEYRLLRHDGEYRYVVARGAPVKAPDGTVREWLGTCDDHHQHRMQEEQNQFLVQLDDLIRPLIDPQEITQLAARMLALQLGVNRCAYADVEGDENTINLTGDYNDGVSSIVGRYRLDSFGPDALQAIRAGQTFVSHDTRTDERTAHNHEIFQHIETAAVIGVPLLKAGRLVAALSVQQSTPRIWRAHEIELVQKVAARCWESIERARITRELRQNEYRLRLAQHAGRIGSFEWLIPENCVIWSDELYMLYGITPGEFSGTFEDWEAHCVPEDAVRVREQIDEYLRAQEGEITYEFRSVHPDGTQRWLRGQAIFLYDSNGTPRKMIGVNVDVDELKRAVEALRTADLRKDEFLATLAHELRNPLAPIRNAIEILQLGNNDAESTQEIQNALERQVRQMTRLVDDLMDVSRITRGKLELIRDRTDLIAVLHSAIETSQPIISGSGQQLTLELASGPVTVDGDFTRLSQVFSNLLNNAAKYSEKGGVIHVRLTVTPTEAIVDIQDQGIGIPEEMLNEVFEPFTQVDRSIRRSQGGLGIGLTLVKRLVELHHGHVSARCNANGAGTVFTITLPRCRTSPPASASPRRAAPGKESLPSHRVLVVDDTPAALFMVSKLLEKLGQTVFTASSAEEGIQLATELRPEIVISDIGMPCMDGYQLAETLRSLPWTSEMWIVALTGYGQESDRMKATAAGFNRHLVKPISLDALTALLREYPQAESNSGDTVRIR